MKKISKWFMPFLLAFLFVMPFTQTSLVEAASKYKEGEYDLPFTVLKGDSDESSMTNDYLVSPAKLVVKDGKNLVQLTLKNSSWWEEFSVASGGMTVLSDENDTRVVQFEVADLDQVLNSKIHVIVPDIDYDNKYDVRFKFDASGIPVDGGSSNSDNSQEASGEKGTDKADGNEQGGAKTDGEENPPTGDDAPIFVFAFVLIGSAFFLIRRFAVR